MHFIFNIIRKNGFLLLFLCLQMIASILIFRYNVYHEVILGQASVKITGAIDKQTSKITRFFNLPRYNRELQEENAILRKQLTALGIKKPATNERELIESSEYHQIYSFIPTDIINNTIVRSHNFLTINKGKKDGVQIGDGIMTQYGIVGIVTKTTDNYARAISILNTDSQINARIKGNEYFGTMIWDGKDPRYTYLTEIPKYITVNIGDTIETDGKSPVFPEGIMIGTVNHKEVDNVSGELKIKVKLRENFANLKYAYVVTNLKKIEINQVESTDTINKDPHNVQ
ncbi:MULTISPECIES: rod shape-determining protein MreC [Weeksella]|uniref:Cell shape-determining protein MreC n=1 Tax=Weeksella virosa (strain ATCC 43766 / DSM 16922 / JCM 21250 / CCUG 30538 / CDC 9751 / IAM 14551 / NBRC 16016 / NCTC 11634 / CL345/78) TaxID=865938 RepID=F0NYN2_WEEVC|nr:MULTISPECIES: rod shape-determining protein MreC [Weeksella]ADX68163.1 rod shape-determining protein MreC [Weeksella virosa DSM 16922]MDK7374853.1 rod shape-determining protein MreC [Weeksella virosa]OFM83948.1 rod shape-determining protein MreC [Weeksella sp. HMSC059D05]SUP54474.1 rod shape-determining protein MreC [Weeksella virosa]VEH64202.1 rod shape-determining protein MreC [Weeksella virosa]